MYVCMYMYMCMYTHTHTHTYIYIYIYFFFFSCTVVCGILVPWPGIRPVPPALEAWSLNHWTAREVPVYMYFYKCKIYNRQPVWSLRRAVTCGGVGVVILTCPLSSTLKLVPEQWLRGPQCQALRGKHDLSGTHWLHFQWCCRVQAWFWSN